MTDDTANVYSFAEKMKSTEAKKKRTYEDAIADSSVVTSTQSNKFQVRGINWFWNNRIARVKLALLGGLPDKGKSLVALDIIAKATTGGCFHLPVPLACDMLRLPPTVERRGM